MKQQGGAQVTLVLLLNLVSSVYITNLKAQKTKILNIIELTNEFVF